MKVRVLVFLTIMLFLGLASCVDQETHQQGFTEMEKREAERDASAWYGMGLMHEQGFVVAQDKSRAAFCYRKAAEKGQVQAQYRLGFLYYHGQGVPRDLEQAAEWYRKAAEEGYPLAQVALGNMYLSGEGVPRDSSKAAYWQKKSLNRIKLIDLVKN